MAFDRPLEQRPVTQSRAGALLQGLSVPAALVVAGVLLLTIVVRYLLALEQTAPWLMGDELRYADMAKSFVDEGSLLFREQAASFATAYPALVAPAWAADEVSTAYHAAKAINVVLMTLTAVVVFFWARRLVPVASALVAAGLVLLMPTFVYTGMVMMESAALPASVLGAFVIARALERPTLAWQLAVFASIAVATLVRIQLVTLMLVYATAIILAALFAQRAGQDSVRAALRRFVPSFGIAAAGALLYVAARLLSGGSLASGFGAYDTVVKAEYSLVDTARWSLWHLGELALSVGFLPAVCFGVLLAAAIRSGGLPNAADRAFVAVAAASTFWFVLQASAFASRYTQRIEERYMVYAAPILLIALVVWLRRDLPRRTVSAFVAALVPALLVMTIPYERLFNVPILADTVALIPFLRLSTVLGSVGDIPFVVAGGLVVATIAFLTFSTRAAYVLFSGAVAMFFVLSGYTVYGAFEVQSAGAAASTSVSNRDWVDDMLGPSGRAAFLFTGSLGANPHALWQTEFWNRSVRDVYVYRSDPSPTYGGMEMTLDGSGRLVSKGSGRPIDEDYVLADPTIGIVGDAVAMPGLLALIRIDRPARIARSVEGVYADGWTGPEATLSQFEPLANGARRLRVHISRAGWTGPDVPARVTIAAGPVRITDSGPTLARATATREWTVHSNQEHTFALPVPPVPFRVEVRVSPTFSPAQFGLADTRQLGVQVAFGGAPS
jgi:hypothetical protein